MKAPLWFEQLFPYIRQCGGLALLLTIYLVLTLAYSYAIPFSKGPDEYINYQYILFIAKHRRLPATIAEKQEAGVKADWQPLYHLVAGLAATPISLATPPELKVTWEPPTRQLIDIGLPRATLIRTEDERPPYRGVYAVWQMGRWVSIILGAGTLVATYFIGLNLWPGQPALATGMTALLVFMPRFLFTHAVLSDDTMLGFCLALYLLLLVRLVRGRAINNQLLAVSNGLAGSDLRPDSGSGRWSAVRDRYWLFVGLGITAGLAIITKYTAIPVIAGALMTGGLVARRENWPWPKLFQCSAFFVGSLMLAVGWWVGWVWWHFNQVDSLGPIIGLIKPLLPGASVDDNPTTARLTALLSGQAVASLGEAPGAKGNFLDWARQTFVTLWGVTVFGAEPRWPYPYEIIMVGLALGCVMAAVGLWRVNCHERAVNKVVWQAFVLHLLLFLPIPLLRFALSRRLNDAAQGRHLLFPAGPAIAVMLMIGWLVWFRPQWRDRVALVSGSFMLVWAVAHLAYLGVAYPLPLPVRTTFGPQMQVTQSTQIDFGDTLRLIGYQTQLTNEAKILRVDLLWHSLAQAWEDYRTEITLIDSHEQPQLRWLSHPTEGRFPVRAWQPGDVVRDTLLIPVVGLPPGDYDLKLRLLGWEKPLPSANGETLSLTTVTLKAIPVLPEVALWQQGKIVTGRTPTYRYRSTIPVTTSDSASVVLVGPNEALHSPIAEKGHLHIFIVDYDWPSGDYRLQLEGLDSGLNLRIENFLRNFTPPPMMHSVQANFANKVELLGYDLPLRRVKAGQGVPLVLYWRGLTQMHKSYTIFVQLLDASLQRRGGYDRLPRETYPTYLWVPGEVVDDGFAVPIEAQAPAGVYTIRIGLYQIEDRQAVSLPLMQMGHPLDETSVVIGPLKVGGPPAGAVAKAFSPQHPLTVNLGETIALHGYDLKLKEQTVQLDLYWLSLAQTDIDYTVFVHVRDEAGNIMAQVDRPAAAGQYPTSLWDKGEVIPDVLTLNLPPELKPGRYQLAVGLYDPATGSRLAVPGTLDNSVVLTEMGLN